MPDISGVGSFVWPAKHKDLADSFEMFWVTMKCPDCDHEWEWKPSKADLNNTITDIVTHKVQGKIIAYEGNVAIDCLACDGVARFKGGIHEDGGIFITAHGASFDNEWWTEPYGDI